jgi:hypothetical protein
MKRIISNKVYDTATARELARIDTGSTAELSFWCESLYQKRTGEYFIHGEGGPMSRYAVSVGQNEWGWGEKIIPLSAEKARAWAEEHLDTEEYERIFGIPDEGAGRVTLCVQIPADLDARIRQRAAEEGITLSALIEKALQQ